MWLIFTITTADNLTFFHCKRFEFTCDVKSFLDINSNHSLSPSPLAWFSCKQRYFHFTMTKMPRRPPCRPYLLPSIDFNTENIGFLPPSSQPIVRCARTIWAAINSGHHPSPSQSSPFESTSSVRWHRCCCQPNSSSSLPHLPTLFDRPEIAVNAVGEEKMVSATKCNWYVVSVWWMLMLYLTRSRTQHRCCCQPDSGWINTSLTSTFWLPWNCRKR